MANPYNATEMALHIKARTPQVELKPILASEVINEFEKRCSNGMQYTTFPNTISSEEKAKLTALGYIVTENTVPSDVRYGQGDLYIGFQVALNSRAADESMQVNPNTE